MSAEAYREAIKEPKDHLMLGLDNMTWDEAKEIIVSTSPSIGMAKINSLHDIEGWRKSIDTISDLGMLTVADGAYHNTPKVVENHARNVTGLGAAFITVHASGGPDMLAAAVTGRNAGRKDITNVHKLSKKELFGGLLAETILTHLDDETCESTYGDRAGNKVLQFAHMARDLKFDGIVCSALELQSIRADSSLDDMLVAVASITPPNTKKLTDQKRTASAGEAIENGADYLMLGRNITQAKDRRAPSSAANAIAEEVRVHKTHQSTRQTS